MDLAQRWLNIAVPQVCQKVKRQMAACVEAKERRSERRMLIARKKKITEEKDEGMKFNLGCRGGGEFVGTQGSKTQGSKCKRKRRGPK